MESGNHGSWRETLLARPFPAAITGPLKTNRYSKRSNVLRVMGEASKWGKRDAAVNALRSGIILTPLANDEVHRLHFRLDGCAGKSDGSAHDNPGGIPCAAL